MLCQAQYHLLQESIILVLPWLPCWHNSLCNWMFLFYCTLLLHYFCSILSILHTLLSIAPLLHLNLLYPKHRCSNLCHIFLGHILCNMIIRGLHRHHTPLTSPNGIHQHLNINTMVAVLIVGVMAILAHLICHLILTNKSHSCPSWELALHTVYLQISQNILKIHAPVLPHHQTCFQ